MAKMFGGTPKKNMFGYSPENGSISERTVNRALKFHTTAIKFCINKKKYVIFIFAMYQNYPMLALTT